MKTFVAMMALGIVLLTAPAFAITIPSGHVLTTGEDGKQTVAHAATTKTAIRSLKDKGYHIGGGQLHLLVEGMSVSIDLNELRGKSKADALSLIKTYVVSEIANVAFDDVEKILRDLEEGGEISEAIEESIVESVVEAVEQISKDDYLEQARKNSDATDKALEEAYDKWSETHVYTNGVWKLKK